MLSYPNAKINIGLYITEKREDGFHNLETIFYPTTFSDILEIHKSTENNGNYKFVNYGTLINCTDESNLIVKAYKLLCDKYNLPAINIYLQKIIPMGAGLGGGSADAAYMINCLNKYFKLNISKDVLQKYAENLGSDCPFFIENTPCFASGKGEILESINLSLQDYKLIIVKPACKISTADAYANIKPQKAKFDLRKLPKLPIKEWKNNISNDFEANIFKIYPEILNIKQCLYKAGAIYASMSGSGSAVYGIFAKDCKNISLAENINLEAQKKSIPHEIASKIIWSE